MITNLLTRYQLDSIERRALYGKKVDEKPFKFGLQKNNSLYGGGSGGGLKLNAPLSALIQKRTRRYKCLKAFQDNYRKDDENALVIADILPNRLRN